LNQNNALERLNRDLKDMVDHRSQTVNQLGDTLSVWLGKAAASSTPREHPLLWYPSSKEAYLTGLNVVYRGAAEFTVDVETGNALVVSAPAQLATSHTQYSLERHERIAAALHVRIAAASEALAATREECKQALQQDDFWQTSALALQCEAHRAAHEALVHGLAQTNAKIAQLAAAPAAVAPPVDFIGFDGPSIVSANCLLIPADWHLRQLAESFPDPALLRGAVLSSVHKWMAVYVPLPHCSAQENLTELLRTHGRFHVLERRMPWDGCNWSCTCIDFLKDYRCKHMLAVAIAEGTWEPPARFSNFTPLARQARGRPPSAAGRYRRA
jgi:hypothetical protein